MNHAVFYSCNQISIFLFHLWLHPMIETDKHLNLIYCRYKLLVSSCAAAISPDRLQRFLTPFAHLRRTVAFYAVTVESALGIAHKRAILSFHCNPALSFNRPQRINSIYLLSWEPQLNVSNDSEYLLLIIDLTCFWFFAVSRFQICSIPIIRHSGYERIIHFIDIELIFCFLSPFQYLTLFP